MLQSLGDPFFGPAFLLMLATGGIGILAGAVAVAWPRLHPVDTGTERATYLGGVGLAAFGCAIVALGFMQAGVVADLYSTGGADSAVSPSSIGVIGQALPWYGIALVFGVVAMVALIGGLGISVYTDVASDD
ncbi:hypothetical protein ACODNH_06005 [Haloarcula sp. NS06]|uniref:hypothetical protein n=1 Tax=Haloarcula sp. NS06 TaxID=3409688 RepID=UPI003DA755A7